MMKSYHRLTLLIAVFASTVLATRIGSATSLWQVGAAKTVITPDEPMWMSGYASRDRPADGKSTELWAKALVLEDHTENRRLLITLDLIGLDRHLSQTICERIKERHGLERAAIALCMSHTHSGPVVGLNLRAMLYDLLDQHQKKLVDEYTQSLLNQIDSAVSEAIHDLRPSLVSWGSGKSTFAVNRRNNRENQVMQLRGTGDLAGPVDHDVPVLAVRRLDESLRAVVFGYACHGTVLSSFQWSGDYMGYAQIALEAVNPDCVAMFWAGCAGDQNPLPRRKISLARRYGLQLADAVQQVLAGKMELVTGNLKIHYQEITLPLGPLPSRQDLLRNLKSEDRYVTSRARLLLRYLDETGKLDQTYPYPISTWHFGDQVKMVILGGEVVVDYAIRLKSELGGIRTWVAGYSNDVMAYIPSRRVLREGGYEGATSMIYYGMPTTWSPEIEQLIVDEVHRQAK